MLGSEKLDQFVSRSFTGIVTTVRENGTPASSMISYARLGDNLYFSTTIDRLKGKALLRDSRLALCVVNDLEPNSYVTVEGSVIIHRNNPKELHERMFSFWAGFVEKHPKSPWAFFGRENLEKMWAAPGRAIFEVQATRVSGYLL
jgi:nitroimidazol reductase NimA-like FMN-containing flavoprotein (pyridoxamine 5'-phosphate oxidase superfamily)